MAEKSLWKYLKNNMKKRWDATRHEDRVTSGVPDVSYGINGVNGWIELKAMARWPREGLRIPGFTLEQKRWLQSRDEAGGNVWIFLRIGRDYLLISGKYSFHLDAMDVSGKYPIPFKIWDGSVDWDEFAKIIGQRPPR